MIKTSFKPLTAKAKPKGYVDLNVALITNRIDKNGSFILSNSNQGCEMISASKAST